MERVELADELITTSGQESGRIREQSLPGFADIDEGGNHEGKERRDDEERPHLRAQRPIDEAPDPFHPLGPFVPSETNGSIPF